MPAVAAIAVAVAGSAGTAMVGSAVTFGLVSGTAASIIGGVVIGAVAGGITAAVMGEDIVDGAIQSGIIGGAMSFAAGWGAESIEGSSGTMGMGSDAASLSAAEDAAGLVPASEVAASGSQGLADVGADFINTGEIEAGTGNISSQMAAGKVSGTEAVKVTANNAIKSGVGNVDKITAEMHVKGQALIDSGEAGSSFGSTSKELVGAAKKNELGLFGDMTSSEKMMMTSGLVQGVGDMYGAKIKADAEKEMADTAYERSKKKLQEGVNLEGPTFAINEEEYAKSRTSPTGAAQTVNPVQKFKDVQPIRQVARTEGLLNKTA